MTEPNRGLPRRAVLLVSVLAAVVLLFAGYEIGVLTTEPRTPADTSAEAGFARDMMTHHNQAIEMGMIAWQQGNLEAIRVEGYDIATNQSDQVGQMRGWLKAWRLDPTGPDRAMAWMPGKPPLDAEGLMPGMATKAELDRLRAARGPEFDILFCQLMLRHHQGGIHMAEAVLKLTEDDLVIELAGKIKAAQAAEVEIFRKQLTELGAKPLE